MNKLNWIIGGIALAIVIVVAVGIARILEPGTGAPPNVATGYSGMIAPGKLLRVPVTGVYPGGLSNGLAPDMPNPLKDDPDAVARGQKDFDTFNCSGCHMARGGGGMGPALSDNVWFYRDSAANLYLDIAQGRSAGMPAFGAMLPDRTIWELVAYIQSIAEKKGLTFGTTTSAEPQSPTIEQVPAEKMETTKPWQFTEPMPPNGEQPGSAKPDENPPG
jgi:cytochrome c oxidase cbb3-type subunit III